MVEQDVEPAAHLANTKTLELVNYVILTVPHVSHPPQIACPVACLEEIRPTWTLIIPAWLAVQLEHLLVAFNALLALHSAKLALTLDLFNARSASPSA